jgi:hypothetical protein
MFQPEDPLELYGHDYMVGGHALMYGESLLGDRVCDVLSAVALLRAEGAEEVHLAGRKQGALLGLLAGLLDPKIKTVASREAPDSFLELATAAYTFWPAVNLPHGALAAFDLPDVRASLGSRLIEDTRAPAGEFTA